MAYINFKEEKYKGKIQVEKRKKNVECEYCGANFVVDDNTIEVKHLNAGEINEEQEYINADTNLNKLKNYDEAYNIYLSLSKRYVDNPEVWIGLLRSLTKDFTYKYATADFKKLYQKYWNNYIALAEKKDIDEYSKKYKEYVDNVEASSENNSGLVKSEKCYIISTVFAFFKDYSLIIKLKQIPRGGSPSTNLKNPGNPRVLSISAIKLTSFSFFLFLISSPDNPKGT